MDLGVEEWGEEEGGEEGRGVNGRVGVKGGLVKSCERIAYHGIPARGVFGVGRIVDIRYPGIWGVLSVNITGIMYTAFLRVAFLRGFSGQ